MATTLTLPALGEDFPRTEVDTNLGPKILPDDYKGKWFVLFSHPGDFTPVCTSEFESFAMEEKTFKDMNCELIGLSLDTIEGHQKWVDWINEHAPSPVNFPIIGNESANIMASKLGMVHKKLGNAAIRAVFIVDDKGVLRLMMYYPMVIGRNISEVVRSVKALQVFDKSMVLTPADYPHNKWLGENVVLVPGAYTEQGKVKLAQAVETGEITQKAPWFNYEVLK